MKSDTNSSPLVEAQGSSVSVRSGEKIKGALLQSNFLYNAIISNNMPQQPSFSTPVEAIDCIRACLQQNDSPKLFAAFTQETRAFWKDILIQHLRDIQDTETLERVFLEDGLITSFPQNETVLHLGGHSERTHHLHIRLVKSAVGWVLDYIQMCR